jgi:hypothetical protein
MRRSPGARLVYLSVVVPLVVVGVVLTARFMDEEDWVTVTTSDELEQEEIVYSEDLKLFVIHRESGPLALSAVNPHLGTYLTYCPRSGQFQGRHGEKFDRFGVYYAGPSQRNMDRVAAREFGDAVQVLPDKVTRGAPRMENGAATGQALEPEGPFCPDSPSGVGGIYGPVTN